MSVRHYLPRSIRQSVSSLYSRTPHSRRKHHSRNGQGNLPAVESLEQRTLLVAPVTVGLNGGLLKITGTAQADDVQVCFNDDQTMVVVTVDGAVSTSFASLSVINIEFRGKGGNDTFRNKTGIKSKALGGAGDDVLLGGSGKDILLGNGGKDTIKGGKGNDDLRGGGGGDILNGEQGNDILRGNSNDDILLGGPGNDQLNGGPGRDVLNGGPGTDNFQDLLDLIGNQGNDAIFQDGFPAEFQDLIDLIPSQPQKRTAQLQNGQLIVNGSNNRDVINVRQKGTDIQVRFAGKGSKTFKFFSHLVQKIFVSGKGGNDSINIRNSVTQDTYIFGGAGTDLIRSWGSGHNFVLGGHGRDTLYGGSGNSHLFGGPTKHKDIFRNVQQGDHIFKRSFTRNDLRVVLNPETLRFFENLNWIFANLEAADENKPPISRDGALKKSVKYMNGGATEMNIIDVFTFSFTAGPVLGDNDF